MGINNVRHPIKDTVKADNSTYSSNKIESMISGATVEKAETAETAETAEKDINGNALTSYIKGGALTGTDLSLYDGNIEPVSTIDLSGLNNITVYEIEREGTSYNVPGYMSGIQPKMLRWGDQIYIYAGQQTIENEINDIYCSIQVGLLSTNLNIMVYELLCYGIQSNTWTHKSYGVQVNAE